MIEIPGSFYPKRFFEAAAYDVLDREGKGGKFKAGDGTKISRNVSIDISADVLIGERCCISEEVMILTHEHDVKDFMDKELITVSPLVIEDDVFIGTRAIILPNVNKIGHNSFIGAGSIVTKDVPALTLVAGNPAKIIRSM